MSTAPFNQIRATISRHRMWRAGDRVGLGVSGGSDSVALLLILKQLRRDEGIRLTVLHFNHGLRAADSNQDEQFVAALAERLELPFISERQDIAAIARAQRWNVEDAGRRSRYAFFARLVEQGRIDRAAVAHTADDQAETVLLRLIRGTGPAGLAAIYPVNGHVVRPLLEVRRADLRAYLESEQQPWREDLSNYDRSRLRAKLRHEVLPMLERDLQPAIIPHLTRLAEFSREDESFWQALTRTSLDAVAQREHGRVHIRCADIRNPCATEGPLSGIALPEAAQEALARRLIRGIVKEVQGSCRRWTADHVERVLALAGCGSSGSRLELPGVTVERSFDWLSFAPADGTCGADFAGGADANRTPAARFERIVELGHPGESTAVAVPEIGRLFRLKVVDWHVLRRDTVEVEAALDRDLLDPPLVLRNWCPGDFFRPKGRRSSRKLKQFLRIQRVAVRDREGWPVLTSANTLVWTRGLPVAADFAPRPETRTGVIIAEEKL